MTSFSRGLTILLDNVTESFSADGPQPDESEASTTQKATSGVWLSRATWLVYNRIGKDAGDIL
jgi:hypothetical protein